MPNKPKVQKTALKGISKANARATALCPKKVSKRLQYLGKTPGKGSKTGKEVFDRMFKSKEARTIKGKKEFLDPGPPPVWRNIKEADMGHIHDAVTYWNKTGRKHGAKSLQVRKWMLDSNNYKYEYYRTNRSKGAKLNQTYLP
jgi:HNH/ENDO VII superfamily nuclease with conserved GHE residues